jgi:hypothetical protein
MRNRLGRPGYPQNAFWQTLLSAPRQYDGYTRGKQSLTNIPTLELGAATTLYGGSDLDLSQNQAMDVGGATCFFSPDLAGWQAIQSAMNNSTILVTPAVRHRPTCFTRPDPATQQFVYKRSISASNSESGGPPSFIFVRYKNPEEPAVIDIP